MFELIRKSILAGIGVAVLTAEKVQEITNRLVKEGKISTDEAENLAAELFKSGEKQWDEMSGKIAESVRKGMDSFDLVKRKELQELRARVEMLEQRVALLEDARRQEMGVAGEY